MSKFNNALKFFVSFLLMFALIAMQLSFFVSFKVLNGEFYKNALNKNNYYSLMRKDIDYGFKNLSLITSIPAEIFEASVSNDDIIKLSNKNISSAEIYMNNTNKYIDSKIDTTLISDNLQTYVKKNNITVDENLKNQLLAVTNDAGNIINNYAILFNINAVDKYPQFQSLRRLLYLINNIKIVSAIAVLLLIALLVFLNKKALLKMLLWIGSSFIPAGMITLIPSILALYYNVPNRFAINSAYLKVALRDISLGYINYFMLAGVAVLLIGICCMCTYSYLTNKEYTVCENNN
jgi:hypothetical protein